MTNRRPILITGMPRSGSNLLGWCLASSGQVRTLNEVCRPAPTPPGAYVDWPIPTRYTALPGEGEAEIRRALAPLVELRPPWWNLPKIRDLAGLRQWARFSGALTVSRARGHRLLLKDTAACALAGWFADEFHAQVAVIVRHPAGLAAGFKRMGWTFHGEHVLAQPDLEPILAPIWDRLAAASEAELDPVDSAGLLWSTLLLLLLPQLAAHQDWELIEYEDLAQHPWATISGLASAFDLPTSAEMEDTVRSLTEGEDIELARGAKKNRPHRDSRAAAHSWRARLDPDEIARVRMATASTMDQWPGKPLVW